LHKYAKSVREVLQPPVLDFGKEDVQLSAKLEAGTEKAGTTIRRTDAIIAAVTTNNGASLYILDLRHFKPLRAHGLKLFD